MAIALYEVVNVPRKAQPPKPPDLDYGAKIAALRKASGYTQEQLAQRLGLKKDGYRMYEKGYSRVRADGVVKWATALKRPVKEVAAELDIQLFTVENGNCLSNELIAMFPPETAADLEQFIRDTAALGPEEQAQVLESARIYLAGTYVRRPRA